MEKKNIKNSDDDILNSLIADTILDLKVAEEILEKEITPVGNSGHITIPQKHIGKFAKVIIHNRKKERYFELKKYNKEDKS